ncbi:hypothetical protein ACGFNV_43840 [Streptomyces sp. NPDC048751]|uniref:hypothetical protein n=1 Tax=Streptomyces sp. NPDC048751 TaxID=3365591 RepID=UPI00371F6CAA
MRGRGLHDVQPPAARRVPGDLKDARFCREVVERTVAELGSEAPLGRAAQPEEIAPTYVCLASDASGCPCLPRLS